MEKKIRTDDVLNAIQEIAHIYSKTYSENEAFSLLKSSFENTKLKVVEEVFQLSTLEALIFSILFYSQIQENYRNSLKGISEFLQIPTIELYRRYEVLDSLERKGLISINTNSSEEKFNIKSNIFKQVIRQNVLNLEKKNLSIYLLSQNIYKILDSHRGLGNSESEMRFKLSKELDEFEHLKELKLLHSMKLSIQEKVIFLYVAYGAIVNNSSVNIANVSEVLFPEINSLVKFNRNIQSGLSPLIRKKIIVQEASSFMGSDYFVLNEMGIKIMSLAISKKKKPFRSKVGRVVEPDKIGKVDLFYNDNVKVETENLIKLLRPTNFKKCIKRLKKRGINPSVSVIFFGPPGTGKTELVYQLARKTKRKIFLIDLTSIRDKWVGESEKKVAKIFSDYYRLMKMEIHTPILFFNESDALLSKRVSISGSTDQMNNSMQNIFLQKLEDFKGIVMATSNLIENLDEAFERRFLYKLQIEKPNALVRSKIFGIKFPELSKNEIQELANEFELTGGQISNVLRRWSMDLLFDDELGISRLKEIIQRETSYNIKENRVLGFIK